jgi:hypothetical protein
MAPRLKDLWHARGGDIMAAEFVVLAKLSNTCFLINSMAMVCVTVLVFILATMVTWKITKISEFSSD